MKYFILSITLLLASCTGMPDNIKPVQSFELQRYLGTWYEIARLDHSFERGLSHVTANYTVREDGGVKVINRGYSKENKEWEDAEGKAYFVDKPDTGYLKVSFFGPFYGSYVIFELEEKSSVLLVHASLKDAIEAVSPKGCRFFKVSDWNSDSSFK